MGNTFIEITENFIQPIRNTIIEKINIFIPNTYHNHFAKALLIGERTNIDTATMEIYAALGIIHIIAISGMHLDIIFKNLVYVTGHLPRKMFWRLLELVIVLITVWIYTFIAFASPSVVRASIFFSLFFIFLVYYLFSIKFSSIYSIYKQFIMSKIN